MHTILLIQATAQNNNCKNSYNWPIYKSYLSNVVTKLNLNNLTLPLKTFTISKKHVNKNQNIFYIKNVFSNKHCVCILLNESTIIYFYILGFQYIKIWMF